MQRRSAHAPAGWKGQWSRGPAGRGSGIVGAESAGKEDAPRSVGSGGTGRSARQPFAGYQGFERKILKSSTYMEVAWSKPELAQPIR